MSVKAIKLKTILPRVALLGIGLISLISVFFVFKWCFAYTISIQSEFKEVAEFAVLLGPNIPQTHLTLAVLNEKTFLPEDLAKSLAEYEKAVALAPNDFRLWFALGKARERNGDGVGAELALKKAVELAPNYAWVLWGYGNVLLRQGKTTEGFAEMRKAAKGNQTFVNSLVATAWQVFEGDLEKIKQNIGDSTQVNFVLPIFLAKQNRLDEAMTIWDSLPADAKKTTFKESGEEFFKQLVETKNFREALQIQTQIRATDTENFAVGTISNSSFETDIKPNADIFGWQIADGIQPQIGVDVTQKRGGNQSLVVVFNSVNGQDFRGISQTVVVEAGKTYGFAAFYRANLRTSATLKWEVVDAADGKSLAMTEPIAANTDWSSVKTDFTVPENTQAITLRLARDICKSNVCPISGKIWFDDFELVSR